MVEFVILVDKNDNKIGLEEKVKCHLPNGKLHRAFTTLLFDKNGKKNWTIESNFEGFDFGIEKIPQTNKTRPNGGYDCHPIQ